MKKLTHEEFENKVKTKHKSDIQVLGEYINSRTPIKVMHKCGYIWNANPHTLTLGHGCPKCSRNMKRTTEEFKGMVRKQVGEEYTVLSEYKNNTTPIIFKHEKCETEFEMSPKNFLKGQRCPNERYKKTSLKNSKDEKEVRKQLDEYNDGEYTLVGDYKGITRKATVRHNKCGRLIKAKPYLLLKNSSGCPHCYKSKAEDIIYNFLESNGYDFKEQFRIKECRNIRPLPFDFAIFKNNQLWLLIEYDGIQHFIPKFGEENLKKTQYHDMLKTNFCEENNISLARIKYKRIYNQEKFAEYVESELKKILSLY